VSLHHRAAALTSWAKTADRTARTEAARAKAPSGLEYWLARLDPCMDAADPETRLKAAVAARRAYYSGLAHKANVARRRKRAGVS